MDEEVKDEQELEQTGDMGEIHTSQVEEAADVEKFFDDLYGDEAEDGEIQEAPADAVEAELSEARTGEPVTRGTESQTPDETQALRDQVGLLTKQLNELSAQAFQAKSQIASAPDQQRQSQFEPIDFFTAEDDIDAILDDPKVFKEFVNSRLNEAVKSSVIKAAEVVMTNIPQTVVNYIQHHGSLQKIVDEFYVQNAELRPVSQLVAHVANNIQSQHPEMPLQDVLATTAKQVREITGLRAQAINNASKRPAFAGVGGAGRGKKPATNSVADQIDELMGL